MFELIILAMAVVFVACTAIIIHDDTMANYRDNNRRSEKDNE